jgi:hypothetical protein
MHWVPANANQSTIALGSFRNAQWRGMSPSHSISVERALLLALVVISLSTVET